MFLGLPDLDQDPLVLGTDPAPRHHQAKVEKNLDSYCFVTSL
jgi:hypothetical protein